MRKVALVLWTSEERRCPVLRAKGSMLLSFRRSNGSWCSGDMLMLDFFGGWGEGGNGVKGDTDGGITNFNGTQLKNIIALGSTPAKLFVNFPSFVPCVQVASHCRAYRIEDPAFPSLSALCSHPTLFSKSTPLARNPCQPTIMAPQESVTTTTNV